MSVFKLSSKLDYKQQLDGQRTYNLTLRPVRVTIVAVEMITYFENVFAALGIQHEMGMLHIVIWCLPSTTIITIFDFKKKLLNIKFVL